MGTTKERAQARVREKLGPLWTVPLGQWPVPKKQIVVGRLVRKGRATFKTALAEEILIE